MKIGNKNFSIGSRTFIVGILNITPDSFYDGGIYNSPETAVKQAIKLAEDGADIIEIGGESSRPGFTPISADEEISRVLPVLQRLMKEVDVPISVDTCKAAVAEAALESGASMINDVCCFKRDPDLPSVCAKYKAVCCVMHNRNNMHYNNLFLDVMIDITNGVNLLTDAGVHSGDIIIDPGIGFAKTVQDNLAIMRNLSFFTAYEYPVMVGTSRKSFIGKSLGLAAEDRLEATLATTALAISQHCSFIRVHDVYENKRAAMMADEIIRSRH